ncbi:MAG: CPBP family intramembrane metalloprotease [Bacteroidales bacterium]|nr:CPBP family intramembrane metalloprotease [Bacteroidales bacterium]
MGIKTMPYWKWALVLAGSLVLAILLYGASSLTSLVDIRWLRWIVIIAAAGLMLSLYSVFVRWFEGERAKDLPMKLCARHTAAGLLTGLCYFVIVVGIMILAGCYGVKGFGNNFKGIADAFFMFLLVAVGEEIIFRGVLFRWVDEKFGLAAALIASALIFGAVHWSNPGGTWWSSLAIAIEAGLLLGAAYKYSGTLWLPIGIHWAWNFSQGNVFGFEVSGADAGASWIIPSVQGPAILTGGNFGAEASIIAVAVGALIAAALIYATVKDKRQ